MLHRDLKPANIVIDNGRPRIADFGSVIALADGVDFVTASKHSILYRPPESFATDRYTIKGDIYQVGLLVYQLLGGYLSYDGLKYLNKKEIEEYKKLNDDVDKTIYIDSVIQKRAESGTLVDFSTLPPWITRSAKRLLKSIIDPRVENRLSTIADVAAVLTQMRSNILNWKFVDGKPTLYLDDSI
jgi:serine/threonine protein kinase